MVKKNELLVNTQIDYLSEFFIVLFCICDKIIIERSKRKVKKNNIIIGVLALIIVLLSGFIVYDKVLLDDKTNVVDKDNLDDDNKVNDVDNSENNNGEKITENYKDYTESCGDKCTIKYTFTKNDNYVSTIDVDDTFFNTAMPQFGIHFYILHDGFLYYDVSNCNDNGYCNFGGNLAWHHNEYLSNLKKFTDVSNIKRIKTYSPGTDVSLGLFLITDEGNVYSKEYFDSEDIINYGFSVSLFDEFAKYEIDDILEYRNGVPYGEDYKVILKDGTVLTKTIKVDD